MKNKEKYLYMEILRIVACFFVIFNHTGMSGFFLFSVQKFGSFSFWIYLIISIFCKLSVPVFFLISGALLLSDENYSWKKLLKRIIKMFIIFFLFSCVYYLYDVFITNNVQLNIKDFLAKMLQGISHLWFFFPYFSFLICMPLLRIIVKNMKDKHFYYILLLNIIFQGILPIVEYLIWPGQDIVNGSFRNIMTNMTFVCPCMGYFIKNRLDLRSNKRIIKLFWILSCLALFITSMMVYHQMNFVGIENYNEYNGQTFYNCFSILFAVTVFITIKYIFEDKHFSNLTKKIIISVGSCVFGVYLIHVLLMKLTKNLNNYLCAVFNKTPMLYCFIYCLLIFAISSLIILFFKFLYSIILKKSKNKN